MICSTHALARSRLSLSLLLPSQHETPLALVEALNDLLPSRAELPDFPMDDFAVVSNSSVVLGAGMGAEIDAKGAVMRFNEFRVRV